MDLVPGFHRYVPHIDRMDKGRLGALIGFIREREEHCVLPTLEPDRLFEAPPFPGPARQHAFSAFAASIDENNPAP